jgi:hypothetical protein
MRFVEEEDVRRTPVAFGTAAAVAALSAGCATLVTEEADLAAAPEGIRVYPPRVCLLVDTRANDGVGSTVLAFLPDLGRAYDVKPLTILARQDLRLELEAGQITALSASQDTAAFLGLLRDAAQIAAGAAGVGVSAAAPLEGSFGFSDGVHCLRDDGTIAP